MIKNEPTFAQTMIHAFAGAAFVFGLLGIVSISLMAFVLVHERAQKAEIAAPAKVTERLVQ